VSGGRILVVDGDPQTRAVLRTTLTGQGYELDDARSGAEALETLRNRSFDLILVDSGLPDMSGVQACCRFREHSDVAIIVVAVADADSDKVAALDAGASDYITKPVKSAEFLARIRAVLRRIGAAHAPSGRLTLGDIGVDFDTRHVSANGRQAHLTPREFDLLQYFVANSNKVLTHRELLQHAWGPDYGNEVDLLRVVINQLRRKLEPDAARPSYLLTEPRVGYRLIVPQTDRLPRPISGSPSRR